MNSHSFKHMIRNGWKHGFHGTSQHSNVHPFDAHFTSGSKSVHIGSGESSATCGEFCKKQREMVSLTQEKSTLKEVFGFRDSHGFSTKTRNDSNGNMKLKPMKPIVHQPGLPGLLIPSGIHTDISLIYPFDLFKLELKWISFMSHPANKTQLYPNIFQMILFWKVSTVTQLKIDRSILFWSI